MRKKNISTHQIIIALIFISFLVGASFTAAPAASIFFLQEDLFNLSGSEYSHLFILMISGAIFSSYFCNILSERKGVKGSIALGCLLSSIGMLIFTLAAIYAKQRLIIYPLLLAAELLIGLGYGALTASLPTLAYISVQRRKTAAVDALFIFGALGAGVSFFSQMASGKGLFYVVAPLLCILFVMLSCYVKIFFPSITQDTAKEETWVKSVLQKKRWLCLLLVAICYGFCETLINVWGPLFLKTEKAFDGSASTNALSVFWVSIFISRIGAYFLARRYALERAYPLFALSLAFCFAMLFFFQDRVALFLSISLSGMCIGPCLPLMLSWGQKSFTRSKKVISSHVVACYMIGFSFAAFGVGALEKRKEIALSSLIPSGMWVALAMTALALIVLKREKLKRGDFEF